MPKFTKKHSIRASGHVVGYVKGETFYKTVSGSVHFLQKPYGIASDVDALNEAKQAGATHWQVTDRETKNKYSATIALVFDKGVYIDRGFGRQIVLPMQYFSIEYHATTTDAPTYSEATTTDAPKHHAPIQMSFLWGK